MWIVYEPVMKEKNICSSWWDHKFYRKEILFNKERKVEAYKIIKKQRVDRWNAGSYNLKIRAVSRRWRAQTSPVNKFCKSGYNYQKGKYSLYL